jgi:hypothetical protein
MMICDTMVKQEMEAKRKEDLDTLYKEYEKNLLVVHNCIRELKDIEVRLTKDYEQRYLEVAGVR